MAGSGCDCDRYCESDAVGRDVAAGEIINAGGIPTLLSTGCIPWRLPMAWSVNPRRGKTTNWRAVCGRTARTVRREGGSNSIGPPYPYSHARTERPTRLPKLVRKAVGGKRTVPNMLPRRVPPRPLLSVFSD